MDCLLHGVSIVYDAPAPSAPPPKLGIPLTLRVVPEPFFTCKYVRKNLNVAVRSSMQSVTFTVIVAVAVADTVAAAHS